VLGVTHLDEEVSIDGEKTEKGGGKGKGNREKKITKVLTRRQKEYRHKTYELQLQ
jgi:hypothetical protein